MVAKECDAIACQRCSPRTAANCNERCRCQPKGVSPRIPQPGLRKCCWLRLWIVLRLWMSGVQLLGTLRNKLLCTLRHLRQQLRHSLRASEIRLRRTVRTDFLLRVPPRWNNSNWPVDHLTAADHMELVCDGYDNGGSVYALTWCRRPNCAFDRLAVAGGLDTRRAESN